MSKIRYLRSDDMKIVLTDSLVTAVLGGLFLDAINVMPQFFVLSFRHLLQSVWLYFFSQRSDFGLWRRYTASSGVYYGL
jgi:hypothetical protein